MTVVSASTVRDHLDFLVMQPDHERAIVRDLVFAVLAFNKYSRGEPLQVRCSRTPRSARARCSVRASA